MKRTFKYRAYPTPTEERWLYAELKHQKKLYNYMLQMRSQMYTYGSISVSRYDQQAHLTQLRKNSHYGKHPQDMQVSTLKRLDRAYDHFFDRCKDPKAKKKGHPKFKGSVRSVTWDVRKHTLKSGERVRQNPIRETGKRHNMLKVPKLGEVRIRQHRPLSGDPKEVTVKRRHAVGIALSFAKCLIRFHVSRSPLVVWTLAQRTFSPTPMVMSFRILAFTNLLNANLRNFSASFLAENEVANATIRRKTRWQNSMILSHANVLTLSQRLPMTFFIIKVLTLLLPRNSNPAIW